MTLLATPFRRGAASTLLLGGAAFLFAWGRDRSYVSAPYLTCPGAGRVSIRGFSDLPTRWTVVPLAAGSPHGEEPVPSTRHDVELTGLPADRMVEVQVLSDGNPVDGGRLRFRTDPGAAAPSFDFAVTGDSGGSPDRVRELWGYTPRPEAKHRPTTIVRRISATRPQLLIHCGDVVYPYGAREDYRRNFFRPFGPLIAAAPVVAVPGNHDLKTDDGAPFLAAFGCASSPPMSEGKYRSFDYGPLHVALLDSNVEDAHFVDAQAQWLAEDLKNAARPWKIAVAHVPLLYTSERMREASGPAQARVSDALRKVCEEGGVSVVFAGHHHWYERSKPFGGVVQIITGAGGEDVQRYPPGDFARAESYFHFVHGRVEGDVLTLRVIRDNGDEIEPGGVRIVRR